ncbi:MAG: dTMP kinase [Myxococcota bacterium]|jgi:dTMP kinase
MPGIFIAIEGLDGSGGTTQSKRLKQWMEAQKRWPSVHRTWEPSAGPVGLFIREALKLENADALGDNVLPYLFAADRQHHLDCEITPVVAQGGAVITDRYYHSSLAYQSLTIGFDRVAQLNADFRAPDLTVFLDLPAEVCLERILARGAALERFEVIDRLKAIEAAYETVLTYCQDRGENIVRLDASGTVADIHARVIAAVAAVADSMSVG